MTRVTGIVRRIDELGRVVIPKEIRNNLGIKEGDPLEIVTSQSLDGQPMVGFIKYEIEHPSIDELYKKLAETMESEGKDIVEFLVEKLNFEVNGQS